MTHTQFTPACPLVELRQVSHVYEKGKSTGHTVLDKVDLTLNANEIVGLLGRSGSGKSTLLRTVAGLIEPSEGTVRFPSAPDGQANVGMVFQSFALFPWLSVLQNVEVGLEAQGVAPAIRRERALKAIDLIGLDGFENAYPKELSGGMRQRVGLARALVVDPDILLMDEPFSALDVLTAETLRTDLLDLWYEGRTPLKSILIVTHNIEEAVLMCDRILVFSSNPGRVVAEITVDLPQPRDRLDPAFRALVEDIYRRMTTRTPKAPVQEGLFAGMGMAMVLPRVSTNILAGLMEALAGSAYDGKADLPALAAELQYEADELFPIAEVLQLLRFAELEGGDLLLLPAGQAFVEADVDGRKHLFREQLLTHVPLATHIRHALETGGEAGLSARRVRDQLQTHMSETFAQQTLRSVVQWGRYAEAFDYDEKADRFSLEDVV